MRSWHAALKFVAAASLVAAFTVPGDLPDGVYALDYDPATGQAVSDFELLQPSLTKRSMRIRPLEVRQAQKNPPPLEKPKTTCGNAELNRNDLEEAKGLFESLCESDRMYPARNAVIITQGRVIAYMCNYNADNRCWSEEYAEASSILDKQCGNRRSGTVYVDRWKKTYGRDVMGADICLEP